MSNVDVILINMHGDTNMTAAYLHSLIEKAGFSIKTIHFRRLVAELTPPSKKELETLKRVVDRINPEVIMMSVNSMSFWNAVTITRLLKERKIVWGGVQPLIDPERCMNYVDIIVRGEGDEAIIDLLQAIKDKKSISKIKNIWIKKGKKLIRNNFRPLLDNLDNLPFPDYKDNNKLYILGDKIYNKNPFPHSKYAYNITFSRGCPFSCKYCINHIYNKLFKHKYLRRRSVDSAIKELIWAKKNFPLIKSIDFWDDVFLTDVNWLKDFINKYKKYINLPFFAFGNAKFVTEESMRLLKSAGMSFFDLGLQSGSERIRIGIFGRIDRDEQILKADKIIHKFNVPIGYDIIFSEFETEEDMEDGLAFMLKLKKPFKVNRNKLAYYPNFEITNLALSEGRICTDQIASMNPDIITQEITKKQAEKNPMMNYYYFFGKRYIPNFFVAYMFKHKWHKKHPNFLTEVGEIINRMERFKYSIQSMLDLFMKGEFRYVYNRIFNKKEYLPL